MSVAVANEMKHNADTKSTSSVHGKCSAHAIAQRYKYSFKESKCDKAQAHSQEISVKIQHVKEMKSADFTTRPNFENWFFVPIQDRKVLFVNLPDDRQCIIFTKLFSIIQLFLIFEQSTCFIPYHLRRMECLAASLLLKRYPEVKIWRKWYSDSLFYVCMICERAYKL